MKKLMLIAIFPIFLFLLACETTLTTATFVTPVEGDFYEVGDRYENKYDETQLPGQWSAYGAGDPYVFRFNGAYYLYVSTKNNQTGVRAWKSADMVSWLPIDNGILTPGYVSEDPITTTAYAPEVIYWDGMFYMYTSPGGNGHFVLTSASPEGPFVKATENFGESIDGSVFIDDNETMYFLRSFNSGIRMVRMTDPLTLSTGTTLDNTDIGGWTEGPSIMKRDGIYYMTYTGTNVTSPGYRVNYSTATAVGQRSSFVMGDTNSLLLSTNEEFMGLGHNSLVLGPNLDSYYIAYHNLNSAAGPNRSLNISRLFFNGHTMMVNGPALSDNIVPSLPDFSSANGTVNYTQNGTLSLSASSSENAFTAEFNFIGKATKLYVAYQDAMNHHYVDFSDNLIRLYEVKNSVSRLVSTGTMVNNFDFTKLHTIRIISDGSEVSVLFDNMTKINRAATVTAAGKIGFEATQEMKHSAFSNHAFGSSDTLEPKYGLIGANGYLASESNLVLTSMIEELTNQSSNNPIGSYEASIAKEGGYASYVIDVKETGLYGLFMNLRPSQSGKDLLIRIDNGQPILIKLPTMSTSVDFVRTMVTELEIPQGVHRIQFIATSTDFSFQSFQLVPTSMSLPTFSHALNQYVPNGVEYVTLWKILEDGHHAVAGNRQLMYFGNATIQDVTIEVDMKFIGETASYSAGIILKSSSIGLSTAENFESIVGTYIGFNNNRAFINRNNYSLSDFSLAVSTDTRPASEVWFTVKVVVRGNQISVFYNNTQIMEYYDEDMLAQGRIGFYTQGAEVIYKNLRITK
jgi:xylan 1,4-beta-xylosidase